MSKRILTVVGTRPNFIKVTQFDRVFGERGDEFEHRLLHTGQHFDYNMSKVFFEQFKLKEPDYYLNVQGKSPAKQIAQIISDLEDVLLEYQPDLVMVPGDVNSTMAAAIACNKAGIRIAHIESGLRSFDREMPEENNRIVTDLFADILFTTEKSGKFNLLEEGKNEANIFFVGNTMIDTLVAFDGLIQQNPILEDKGLTEGEYAVMTMHRPRNVDTEDRLQIIIDIINAVTDKMDLIFPIHPRTRHRMESFGLMDKLQHEDRLQFTEALDYLAFQKLISGAKCILTDSGGIQEETTFRKVPCLTLRENTERPITLELGSNTLVPFAVEDVLKYLEEIESGRYKHGSIPPLWDGKATERIVDVLSDVL